MKMTRNVIHCAVKTARQEGFKAFYKGFAPSCLRIVSYNIMLWITFLIIFIYDCTMFTDNAHLYSPRGLFMYLVFTKSTGLATAAAVNPAMMAEEK